MGATTLHGKTVGAKGTNVSRALRSCSFWKDGGEIHHPERIIFRRWLQEAGWERRGLLQDISQPCGTEPRSPLSHSLSWKRLDGGPDSWPPPRTLGNGAACCLCRKRKVTAQNTQTRNAACQGGPRELRKMQKCAPAVTTPCKLP